jgi:hypothetical protein
MTRGVGGGVLVPDPQPPTVHEASAKTRLRAEAGRRILCGGFLKSNATRDLLLKGTRRVSRGTNGRTSER